MNIEKRNESYRIVVSCGFEGNKRIKRTSTFTPPKGLTPKQEQKAVLEFARSALSATSCMRITLPLLSPERQADTGSSWRAD